MLQVPRLKHRKLGEMETEETLPPSVPRAPSRAPDEFWEVKGVGEETSLGHQILADHSDPFWVLWGQGVGDSYPQAFSTCYHPSVWDPPSRQERPP